MLERKVLLALLTLIGFAACSPAGPRPIRIGAPCASCGMAIEDLRFACERRAGTTWRQYDSIECLLRDTAPRPGGMEGDTIGTEAGYLADYDARALAPAESLWVVKGDFPSPMGGGLAAFRDRGAAVEIAARTRGRIGRLAEFTAARP